ncbi:hypothetical protein O7621_02280 [Solwaraspora sp. WMMD937]|uniref:hypothetical protein n=1 Tax=Solwaraspora sp. WMMD937 TaxID=3016090 RepID=UPI00249CC1A9|nr:hypothetical protein [Solwaraspora sp. WMMD937]WFE22219.1 hypothetical protein O7621_02280 [Solwaraspora sp. WMMD937]
MRTCRVFAASIFTLGLLTACGGTGSDSVAAGPGDPTITAVPSAWPNQDELNQIAMVVGRIGEDEFAEVYAGHAIDVQDDRVDVWAKDSAEFEAAIESMPWGHRVRLHPADHAAIDLEPTFQQILRNQDYWRQQGLPVVQSGVRHDGSCVEVGTPEPEQAERAFPQRYPGVPFCFSKQEDSGNPWQEDRPSPAG